MLPLGIVLTSHSRAVLSVGGGEDLLPSGLKAAEYNRSLMSFEGDEGGAGGGVPQPRGVVIGGGDDALSVRAEGG